MGLLQESNVRRALDASQHPVPFAKLYVFQSGKDTLCPIFTDAVLQTTIANPLEADADGYFPVVYFPEGEYRIELRGRDNVLVSSQDNLQVTPWSGLGFVRGYGSVALLLADDTLRYSADETHIRVSPGDMLLVSTSGQQYCVAPADAANEDLMTEGGVKLYVKAMPSGLDVEAFGAKGDGVTDDTAACQAALNSASDGHCVSFLTSGAYRITGPLDTSGTVIGKRIALNGATLLLDHDDATIMLGQQGSGLSLAGGELRAAPNFAGNVITLLPQARSTDASRSCYLTEGNIVCTTSTGTAIFGEVTEDDTRIVGFRTTNVTIAGFDYGVYLRSAAPTGVGFINDNDFVDLRMPGRTPNGVYLEASATGQNEVSANKFTNLMTQWFDGIINRHIMVNDARCRRNKFISYDAWDISSESNLAVEDKGLETFWLATIPTSNGVSVFSPTAIGINNKDAGSQVAELMLGEYRRSNSVVHHKIKTFDDADLTTLDVRDGEIFIEGNVTYGTRLTNIIQGGDGQTVTLLFSGNTLLSNGWGGVGEIITRTGSSRYTRPNEVVQLTYDGSKWLEAGAPEALMAQLPGAGFSDIDHSINTVDKFTGKLVWDTTNKRAMRAEGADQSAKWIAIDGSVEVSPA